jgi:hypothetical protein
LISQTVPVGIVGFVLALVGLVLVISNLSGKSDVKVKETRPKQKPKWSATLEERWDRRQQENE